jgi:hypothetical protein
MNGFNLVALCLLTIQVVLLFNVMSLQSKCLNSKSSSITILPGSFNTERQTMHKISSGGIVTPAASLNDIPGIEDFTIKPKAVTFLDKLNSEMMETSIDDGVSADTELNNEKGRIGVYHDSSVFDSKKRTNKQDINNYRERLQANRVEDLDPIIDFTDFAELTDALGVDPDEDLANADPTIDSSAIQYILHETKNNLRY